MRHRIYTSGMLAKELLLTREAPEKLAFLSLYIYADLYAVFDIDRPREIRTYYDS